MTSPIRPIFQEGERLTANRLNAAVEYLRSSLRRVLLSPLSPGVAYGLEIGPAPNGVDVVIQEGLAIDGRGRVLLLEDALTVTAAEIQAMIPDLGVGTTFSICLALDDRHAHHDPCAPERRRDVIDRVRAFVHKTSPQELSSFSTPQANVISQLSYMSPSVAGKWSELDPAGRRSEDFCVRLGHATWSGTDIASMSMAARAGVSPRFSSLRSSFGEVMMTLGRDAVGERLLNVFAKTVFRSSAPVAFEAPVDLQTDLYVKGDATFQKPVAFMDKAGGPFAQAAIVAGDIGSPPAGRVSPADPRVFEAAGGRVGGPIGAGGVLAVSMKYDTALGGGYHSFTHVPHAGFPLALSTSATLTYPELVPYDASLSPSAVGLAAAPSQTVAGAGDFVPLVAFGPVGAMINFHGAAPLPPGVDLTPDAADIVDGSVYPLRPATSGDIVVARTSVPVPVSASTQPTVVMPVPPYPKP